MKANLILEGGGMRGLYTAGVLDCFLDKGIIFQDIIGVSAGACNAVSYMSGQRGRNLEINTGYCTDKRYISLMGLFTRGSIFNMDFLFDDIPNKLVPFDYDKFKQSGIRLVAVVTECETGKARYAEINDMQKDGIFVRASSSIPLVSKIVNINNENFVDGGVSDSVPIHHSVDAGFDKHIIILTRQNGYQKEQNKYIKLFKRKLKEYPLLIEAMQKRHVCYNESVEYAHHVEKQGNAVIICPKSPLGISKFERHPDNLKQIYSIGYEDAAEKFDEIAQLVKGCSNVKFKA